MSATKTAATAATAEDIHHPSHRYPTRWKLGRHHHHLHPQSSLLQVARAEDMAEHRVLVACKRRKVERRSSSISTFCLLPTEILFNILQLIPAELLHEVIRYVCKPWFDIVRDPLFVTAHHHRQMSSPGLLIQDHYDKSKICYFEAVDTRTTAAAVTPLKVTKLQLPLPAILIGCFNGLVLLRDWNDKGIHFVINPVTKVMISLPPLPSLPNVWTSTCFGLTSSGLCKVVQACAQVVSHQVWMRVYTVGVDTAWRYIDLHLHIVNVTKEVIHALTYTPRFIAGFIYWYRTTALSGVALDVDTETIYQFPAPAGIQRRCCDPHDFMSTESCLGLLRMVGDIWGFWKLTDVKMGVWTEILGIDIKAVCTRLDKHFYPRELRTMVWAVRLMNDEEFWFYRQIDKEYLVVALPISRRRRYMLGHSFILMYTHWFLQRIPSF